MADGVRRSGWGPRPANRKWLDALVRAQRVVDEAEGHMKDEPKVTPPVRHRLAEWLLLRRVTSTYDQDRADRSMFIWREVPVNQFGGLLPLYELRVVGVLNGLARRWDWPRVGVTDGRVTVVR